MHRPPPRPCRHYHATADTFAIGLCAWPLRRIGFCLAVVSALLLLRPVLLDAWRCSPTDWAACRSAQ